MSIASAPYVADPAAPARAPDHLRILCILPTLNPYGGVVSVINALDQFMEMGHRCTLVSLSRNSRAVVHPRTEPIHVPDWSRIPDVVQGEHDVLLATSWETVEPIVGLSRRLPQAVAFHFVQDYEPDLEDWWKLRRKKGARRAYDLIENRVAKTEHLQGRLASLGYPVERIAPGMNLDVFYPRDELRSPRPRVVAMARPDAPRDNRGFKIIASAFRILARRRPDIEFALFGADALPRRLGFPVINLGRRAPTQLGEIYSSAWVYVDASRRHGFGRTGAEAMACGTPCVLSDSGGVREYASHGINALIVPVGDRRATADAVERLIDDDDLAASLRKNGLNTVARYGDRLAAGQMIALFRQALSASGAADAPVPGGS